MTEASTYSLMKHNKNENNNLSLQFTSNKPTYEDKTPNLESINCDDNMAATINSNITQIFNMIEPFDGDIDLQFSQIKDLHDFLFSDENSSHVTSSDPRCLTSNALQYGTDNASAFITNFETEKNIKSTEKRNDGCYSKTVQQLNFNQSDKDQSSRAPILPIAQKRKFDQVNAPSYDNKLERKNDYLSSELTQQNIMPQKALTSLISNTRVK